MNSFSLLSLLSIMLAGGSVCFAEGKMLTPDVAQINDAKVWTLINARTQMSAEDGRQVARLDPIGGNTPGKSNNALALLEGVEFNEGVIEVDLKGNGKADPSFLGIAFNVADENNFEAIYFRPFNFTREGFTHHAVQYICHPDFTWQKLRETKPGVYEHAVDPVPDPAGWFHARIEVTRQKVSVWVDQGKQPSLVVDRLSNRHGGKIGLWVDSHVGAFSNLKIVPAG